MLKDFATFGLDYIISIGSDRKINIFSINTSEVYSQITEKH